MRYILFPLLVCLLMASCNPTKKIVYFQDASIGQKQNLPPGEYITIQPQDIISIIVSSKEPQLAALFNLPHIQQVTGNQQTPSNHNGQILGYTVDSKGNIDFPVLGSLHVAGLNREEIARLVKELLISKNLMKDPIVTVDFINLHFSVMGEVSKPGQYSIRKDQTNILEALSMAGDLTIYGKRDKIFLIRTEKERITYQLNLCSSQIYNSPAFYIRQNDLIYVEPNKVRANQATVNGNSLKSVSLWMSIASFLTTIGVLIFK